MKTFKVGDYVRIIADTDQYRHCIGKYGIISQVRRQNENEFVVKFDCTLPQWQEFGSCISYNERYFNIWEMELCNKEYNIIKLLKAVDGIR